MNTTSSTAQTPHEQSTDSGESDLRRLIDEAESLLSHGTEQAGEEYERIRERFSAALASGKDRLHSVAQAARKQAARADEMIHSNPYTAIGVAAGVGLLVGYLVSRSCQCKQ